MVAGDAVFDDAAGSVGLPGACVMFNDAIKSGMFAIGGPEYMNICLDGGRFVLAGYQKIICNYTLKVVP